MYRYLIVFAGLCLYACSPFTSYSEAVEIGSEDGYRTIYQPELQLKTFTFGDIKVATNPKSFRTLSDQKPAFRDILFYGQARLPDYHYYVLRDTQIPRFDGEDYVSKDTVINEQPYVILISRSAPASDRTFILTHVQSME